MGLTCIDPGPRTQEPTEVCLVSCGLMEVLCVHLFLKSVVMSQPSGCPDLMLCGVSFIVPGLPWSPSPLSTFISTHILQKP